MHLGEIVLKYREDHHLSQRQFAMKCGISNGYISMIEKKENPATGKPLDVSLQKLKAIATAMNMSADELMRMTDGDTLISLDAEDADISKPYANKNKVDRIITEDPPSPPDYEKAATKAAEILVQYRISSAPVLPLQILNSLPGVLVRSFTEFADEAGLDRKELVSMYGSEAQDAVTFSRVIGGKQRYIVAYNQRIPFYMLQLSLARELAFIVLGTEESRHEEPRMSEALCFTRHLLCPRPLISSLMAVGFPLTVESVGSLTGCYGRCLAGIRETPGAQVAAGLNRLIRQQFAPFVENLAAFGSIVTSHDDSPPADFGTFMDDYEE